MSSNTHKIQFISGQNLSIGNVFRFKNEWWLYHDRVCLHLDEKFRISYIGKNLEKKEVNNSQVGFLLTA